jgi:hypothetical protein
VRRTILIAAVIAAAGTPADASAAVLRVSPTSVPAGDTVRASGSVGGGCARGDTVTITSQAFDPAREFAGVPAIFARAGRNGDFSVSTMIPITLAGGRYSVSGRCGGGNFGSTSLRVNRSAFVDVARSSVPAGDYVRLFGSVRAGCPVGDTVTILSKAFSGRQQFAGVPAVSTRVGQNGSFSASAFIPVTRGHGTYSIRARCGGGSFGNASLRVTRSAFLDVDPPTVGAGGRVRAFGSVRGGCPSGDTVTIISPAFDPAQEFAGVPAIFARVGRHGAFSVKTTIPSNRAAGRYVLSGRCGGGNFASAGLRVT